MITQSLEQAKPPVAIPWRPDDHEYWTVDGIGHPIQLYWSEMTAFQKLLQLEAEQRATYEVLFNPCGIAE